MYGYSNKNQMVEFFVFGKYPVIDIVNSAGKYQRIYCSDLFSSMEFIALETSDNCLVVVDPRNSRNSILFNNNLFFMKGNKNLYAFDLTGKFLNPIGQVGQGPEDYLYFGDFFLNTDGPTIFVSGGGGRILEYDYNGKYIHSIPLPEIEGIPLSRCSYVGNDLFFGQITNKTGKLKNKYCLFDRNGNIKKYFPNHVFFNRIGFFYTSFDYALRPMQIDDRFYTKDYYNDTIYKITGEMLEPEFVFGLGKYTFSKEDLEVPEASLQVFSKAFMLNFILGTPDYFFYNISVPDRFSRPKVKPTYSPELKQLVEYDRFVYGFYDITAKTNILLNTDTHLQKGIINDINGGLSFFPSYYAGDGLVIDVWQADDMLEMLTDEYFASLKIKDQQAHQKLKELLKNLQDDDNPVIVIAKLK